MILDIKAPKSYVVYLNKDLSLFRIYLFAVKNVAVRPQLIIVAVWLHIFFIYLVENRSQFV
jgi:hypothetical protein